MPAVSVAGAAFTVELGNILYTSQITEGTINTDPTILRTKTLDSVAYDQVDLIGNVSLNFLYDENTGMYEAIQTAIAAALSVQMSISSAVGVWASTAMFINAASVDFPADGIATCTVGLEGEITFT